MWLQRQYDQRFSVFYSNEQITEIIENNPNHIKFCVDKTKNEFL